jgi:hypothetical protein
MVTTARGEGLNRRRNAACQFGGIDLEASPTMMPAPDLAEFRRQI